MRAGIVGLGVIARYYLAALDAHPDVALIAVADVDERALLPLRDTVATYTDHRELLRRERPDALIVTVPNDAHATVCHDALDAGAAVCVEKPLALDLSDGEALLAHARAAGLPLFTAFHRRYNSAFDALRHQLPVEIPIEAVTVRYLERIEEHAGPDGWYLDPARCGGGCVADNGPNAFDLVRVLLGEVTVLGADLGYDEPGIDRRAVVHLRGTAGASATVELDWSYPGERKDLEVRLADGTVHRADLLAGHHGFKASLWHEYRGILTDFRTACRTHERMPAQPDPGLAALTLVIATYSIPF
jgi:predicted dehydrogenase